VSFFSPCVAPLVPGYIGYLSGAAPAIQPGGAVALDGRGAAGSRTAAMRATLLFVGGFSATFMLLGLATASVGRLVVAYRPVLETLAGIVMLAMGAFLLGLLPRPVMLALLGERRIHLPESAARRLRSAGPFALGVVFGAGWTPCIGPVLAAILVYVGAAADRGAGLALLALYSLGFAIPFIAVGLGWSQSVRALGWAKRHARAISIVSGVALVAVGLLYLAGQGELFAVWAQHLAGSAPR
jgi:cytochrome c-type biogenesis protein